MKGLNERNEIKIDKLYKLRILVIVSFVIILIGAVASALYWVIRLKPLEKFENYVIELVHGDSFDTEGVNLVRVGDSVSPLLYDYRYEIDGIVYTRRLEVWQPNNMGRTIEFDYLVSDSSYTVASRTMGLIMLPIVFNILCIVDFVIVKIYVKEREKFIDYSKISIFGGK